MRDLLRASLFSWVGAVAMIAAALIKGKVAAVVLGPAGVGTTAQLTSFLNLMVVLTTLSLGSGIAQHIAKFVGEGAQDDVRRVVQTTLVVIGLLGVFFSLAIFAMAPYVSAQLFDGDNSQANYIRIVSIAILSTSLTSALQSICAGYGAVQLTSTADVVTAFASILFPLALIPLYGIPGAVVSMILISFARLGVLIFGLQRKYSNALHGIPRFVDRRAVSSILTALFRVGAASVVMASSDSFAQLFVRTRIIQLYGVEVNGFYQAALVPASLLLVTGLSFVTSYAFSHVNSALTSPERTSRTNQVFHLSSLIIVVTLSALILLRQVYIYVFLSPKFTPSEYYIVWLAGGEAFKQLGLVLGLAQLLTAGVKIWMTVGIFWAISNAFTAVAILFMGPWAVPLPYFFSGLLYFFLSWYVLARSDKFVLNKQNKTNLLLAILMLSIFAILPLHWSTFIGAPAVLAVWLYFALGPYRRDTVKLGQRIWSRLTDRSAA